ncbi:hypothetical protein HXX76_005433 [Chlamydomonas incerta]|uniref:ABC transporter domain-containing protein n=1 Tax=Chlamydomonas incerta TaxID=51695 RepID=A0A835T2W3_CHLIN|nr:hypothetical protein HXX76_005433 [Chlamydomonas incerta]|eukprot:KAG2437813.1 hypothetical protein HXX76_005433 [Chlamydomonas incerta]
MSSTKAEPQTKDASGRRLGSAQKHTAASRAELQQALDQATNGDARNTLLYQKMDARMKRVGLTMPGVEVRWQDLRVEVDAKPSKADKAKATPLCGGGAGKPRRVILDAGSGVLPPGRMCLLLGPPGGGRSTFLKALCGQLIPATAGITLSASACLGGTEDGVPVRSSGHLRQYGTVSYNGLPVHGGPGAPAAFDVARVATYVSQIENHLPELTVAETLTFAAKCQGSGLAHRLSEVLHAREAAAGLDDGKDPEMARLEQLFTGPQAAEATAQHVARMLGIEHVMDTLVGNEMIKGISGGQKRRVTFGEMIVGMANTLMLDEVSNGLDAAAVLGIVQGLRAAAEYNNVTIMATLLQPAPEVVACFHDVILLSQGVVAYHGPTEQFLPFLAGLGLAPALDSGQELADFAQEVLASHSDQRKYRVRNPHGPPPLWEGKKWVSPRTMRKAFLESEPGRAMAKQMAQPPYSHELQSLVLHTARRSTSELLATWREVLLREARLMYRSPVLFFAGLSQMVFVGFLLATAFVNLPKQSFNDANLLMSVLFFSIVTIYMAGFNLGPVYCQRLPVFYKQRDHRFYSPLAYSISTTLVRIPELLLQSSILSLLIYFSVGFAMEPGRFFIFWFNMFLTGFNSVTTFQFFGAIARDEVAVQGLGAIFMMSNVLVSGFPIARPSIPGWWIWVYWLCPMSWTIRSMGISELSSNEWAPADPADPSGPTIGEATLAARGFFTEWAWVWIGIGYVAGLSLLMLVFQVLSLTYVGPLRRSSNHEHDHELEEAAAAEGAAGAATPAASVYPTDGMSMEEVAAAHDHTAGKAAGAPTAMAVVEHRTIEMAAPAAAHAHAHAPLPGRVPGGSYNGMGEGPAFAKRAGPGPVAESSLAPHNNGHVGFDHGGAEAGAEQAGAGGGMPSSLLPFTPVSMSFRDVSYWVPHPKDQGAELQLLDKVAGCFRPGVLTSLMGASGAGKTTLMDVLAGRKTGGRVEGRQLINGKPKRMSTFARIMGYVEQVDVHNPEATVEEALAFSARLRVGSAALMHPRDGSGLRGAEAVRAYLAAMMEVVELTPLAGKRIGSGGARGGLSTEARKRLTIAVELVANPAIIFMDEPTTGLDARAAAMVMRAVRNTAATGRTVVCTIHQPNREIMDGFDEMLLLKPGGRTIFFGALGPRQAGLVDYFSHLLPGIPPYEEQMNPAAWMLEVTAPAAEAAAGVDFADLFERSELARTADALIDSCSVPPPADVEAGAGAAKPHVEGDDDDGGAEAARRVAAARYAEPYPSQLLLLLQRAFTSQCRNVAYNGTRFAVALGLALLLGSLYWDRGMKRDTVLGVMDIMGIMYAATLNVPMTNMLVVMPLVHGERAVYYRERSSGMYAGWMFAAAQGIAELPFLFVESILYVVVVYCMVHFEFNWVKALWFWLFQWLGLMLFTFMGIGMTNITPVVPAASAISGFLILMWNLFCGFLIVANNIKPWYIWAYYVNPAQWIIYGCVVTQMGDLTDQYITTYEGETMSISAYIQDLFSYDYDMRGWIVLILVGFIIAFRMFAYYGLTFMNFQKR